MNEPSVDEFGAERPHAVEIRCRDMATLIHRLDKPDIITAKDGGWGWMAPALWGVPVIVDPEIPERVMRVKLSDGTYRDL